MFEFLHNFYYSFMKYVNVNRLTATDNFFNRHHFLIRIFGI